MWANKAVQANVATLKARGIEVITPGEGELACGVSGSGRLPEPEALFEVLRGVGGV
jgi:phosphopantothenoylcysteine decarboxylase/phosphopantothenate--cysteine ligase